MKKREKDELGRTRRGFLVSTAAGLWAGWGWARGAGARRTSSLSGGEGMGERVGRGIPAEFPRRFVPVGVDLGDPLAVAELYDRLEAQMPGEAAGLAEWLLSWSELSAALNEEGSVRYIRMTCQTDDPERERAYLAFIEKVVPKIKPREFRLGKKLLGAPGVGDLPQDRYFVFLRGLDNDVKIFRDENVRLQTEEEKLSQKYQKLMGGLTIRYEGREQTLQQMAKYLEQPKREVRQEAWQLVTARRLQERKKLDKLFDDMLRLRAEIAHNAGFANYRDYAFRLRGRFDYGVPECEAFHRAVEAAVVPLFREREEKRRGQMGLSSLRPWDLRCDPLGRPPLAPFATVSELTEKCGKIFNRLDPALGKWFQYLADHDLLDLESRKGKAPGGYSDTLDELRVPFIFANAVGVDDDVFTLLHEAGHAFHSLECRQEPLVFYRHTPLEFAEVASMGMEFLGGEYLDEFYAPADQARSRREQLEGVISLFCWIATVDAFQHWIYTHPGHAAEERGEAWLDLRRRFGGIEDWTGYEDAHQAEWHRQLHIFEVPFYYIEYGIAELGALQVWQRAIRDQPAALRDYRSALALGGAKPLPQLFAAAGIKFDMSRESLAPLIQAVKAELDQLG